MGRKQQAPPTSDSLCVPISLMPMPVCNLHPPLTSNIRSYFIRICWESLTRSIWSLWIAWITLPRPHPSSSSSQTPHLLNCSLNPTLFSNVGVNVLYSDIIYSAVHTNDLFINTLSSLISAWASINLVREHLHLLGSAILGGEGLHTFALVCILVLREIQMR